MTSLNAEKSVLFIKVLYSGYTLTHSLFVNYVVYPYSVLGILLGSGDVRNYKRITTQGPPAGDE